MFCRRAHHVDSEEQVRKERRGVCEKEGEDLPWRGGKGWEEDVGKGWFFEDQAGDEGRVGLREEQEDGGAGGVAQDVHG